MQALPTLGGGEGVVRAASIDPFITILYLAGWSRDVTGNERAVRWTSEDGKTWDIATVGEADPYDSSAALP